MKKYEKINPNKNGYMSIECIVSLGIICLMSYLVSNTLNNSCSLIYRNDKKIQMLNIAKDTLEDGKYGLQNNIIGDVDYYNEKNNVEGYTVETIFEKDKTYYECFKVSVKVQEDKEKVELNSYVTKK